MKEFFKNIADLIKVKSIITLTIIITISVMVVKGMEVPAEYAAFAGSIITYFFTKAQVKE